jgi:hypothetical protein
MTIGQNQHGATVNASIGVLPSGEFSYTFNDPFNMLVNLTNSTGIAVNGGNDDDQFNLENSSGDTINGGSGNDTFSITAATASLNGNLIKGGAGYNLVQINGSGTDVDLTGVSEGTAADSNIEMVVGRTGLTGETVEVNLSQLATSSLTGAGGSAFVAAIGRTGVVTVGIPNVGHWQLLGEVDGNGTGYDASGNVLTGAALSALTAHLTSITNVEGSLAADYAGAANKVYNPATQTYLPSALNAYVFTDGTTTYTVWSDGQVIATTTGGTTTTAYQPAAVTLATQPTLGTFDQFHQADPDPNYKYATGTLGMNPAGLTTLLLSSGGSLAYAAVLANGVTGTVIRGAAGPASAGPNGGNWFGLGPSGGGNTVVGTPAGDIFDLQESSALVDILQGSSGFDVVRARGPSGDDVDLTSGNPATGIASRNIDAVVGNKTTVDTVELDLGTLNVTTVGGVRESLFEAMLGGSASTLTISAGTGTKWVEVATFAPGSTPPAHAEALSNATILNSLFLGGTTYTAQNSLSGYLFEQVNARGVALKYVTIYTDATLISALTPASASVTAMAQSMAQMGASSTAGAVSLASQLHTNPALTLARPA